MTPQKQVTADASNLPEKALFAGFADFDVRGEITLFLLASAGGHDYSNLSQTWVLVIC
jgi:hypothetical protein